MRAVRAIAGLGVAALLLAACSGDGGDAASTTTADIDVSSLEGQGEAELPPEVIEQLATTPVPDTDIALPGVIPEQPAGAPGYSHYVFQAFGDDIVPTMVEGPREGGVRCQDEALPCSYQDLLELAESGDPIPEELGMDRATLDELVDQLRQVHDALDRYADLDLACRDGYRGQPVQVPNMGSHFWNIPAIFDGEFDPSKPEIIMYGVADNEDPGRAFAEGSCTDEGWTGERELVVTGASFILPPQDFGMEHPEAFAGPIDNWHVHYNLCNTFIPVPDEEACDDIGGSFAETTGWMIHVWAEPEFENQLGVFSMWNPAIWPVTAPGDVRDRFDENPDDPSYRSIENFQYGESITVAPGDVVTFANTDAVPHSVTAGEGRPTNDFDTGVFGPGSLARFEAPDEGTYNFFCVLHPGMTGQIVVEE